MVCQVKQERGNVEVVPTEAELVPRLSNPAIQSAFKVQPAAAGVSSFCCHASPCVRRGERFCGCRSVSHPVGCVGNGCRCPGCGRRGAGGGDGAAWRGDGGRGPGVDAKVPHPAHRRGGALDSVRVAVADTADRSATAPTSTPTPASPWQAL